MVTDDTTITNTGVKDRLAGAFEVLVKDAEIQPALLSLVRSFFTNFMNNTEEAPLVELLTQMRDELIPYILEGEGDNQD